MNSTAELKLSNEGGASLRITDGGVSVGHRNLFFMGGYGGGTMGMAYSPAYPQHGFFYKEGSPDEIHLSVNGQSANGGDLQVRPAQVNIPGSLSVGGSFDVGTTLDVGSGDFVVRPGQVGIGLGSSAPAAGKTLDVNGEARMVNRLHIEDSTGARIDIGQWDGSTNRIETSGKPLNVVSYGGDVSLSKTGGASLRITDGGVSVGQRNLFFMGGYGGGTMGMAYSPTYPQYGFFYKEGSPDEIHLSVNGQSANGGDLVVRPGQVTAAQFTQTSDARLKRNLRPCPYGLQQILKLEPQAFSYRPDNPRKHSPETEHVGFVAQQALAAGFTHAAVPASDGYYNLNGQPIVAGLVNAIKELKAMVDTQAAQLEAQASRLANLEAKA